MMAREEISLEVIDTLLDDLNTPGFIAKIHELYTKANKGNEKVKTFNSVQIDGLFDLNQNEWENLKKLIKIFPKILYKKIEERSAAKQGDYKVL